MEDALCNGVETSVRTLDDRILPIVQSYVTPETVKIIPGEGMPNLKVMRPHIETLALLW